MVKNNFMVLGLGAFGMSIVKKLSQYDAEVLAIDKNMENVEIASKYATHAMQLDVRDTDSLKKLSLNNFDIAIITVDDIEASIMASLIFKEEGVSTVIVKSKNEMHKKILQKMGVDKIISPEEEMGVKLAKSLMNISVVEAINFSDDYSLVEIKVLKKWVGKSLEKLDLRNSYGLNVLCIKSEDGFLNISPSQDCILNSGEILFAVAEIEKLDSSGLADNVL